ncbi:MAG: YdiU family protein [Sandaracinaceae bacterium]
MTTALAFDNTFVRELPADPSDENRRRQVRGAAFTRVAPTPVAAPRLVMGVPEVAALLDLPADELERDATWAEVLGGNRVLPGMEPYAACYGGHQFGHWAGQLGDGRAITLGEIVNRSGERWELQLKGAGPTPYSRMGDGRAVLRSSLRELVASEAMHHLGVPTTRALSLVLTGDDVVRDMFYDGRARPEPGAVVARVAPTFLRFGSYEIFAAREDHESLQRLVDYTLRTHAPHLGEPSPDAYVRWVEQVVEATAALMVEWTRVGFVHGVMNTDNMSVLGLTIDYGPYGWLDDYDPDWTPNTTDAQQRRYRFGNQPHVGLWNLARFASALVPLLGETAPLEAALQAYGSTFERGHRAASLAKLGLEEEPEARALMAELPPILASVETDMTIFYRRLAEVPLGEDASDEARLGPLIEAYYAPEERPEEVRARTDAWLRRYAALARSQGATSARERMSRVNPKFVPRNYLAQVAIDAAEEGDPSKLAELLDVMRRPYDEQPGREAYAAKRPEWARNRPGCSTLSCSS